MVRGDVVQESTTAVQRLFDKNLREMRAQTERMPHRPEEESWQKCKSVFGFDEVFKAHRKIQRTRPIHRQRVFSKASSDVTVDCEGAVDSTRGMRKDSTDSMHRLKLPHIL